MKRLREKYTQTGLIFGIFLLLLIGTGFSLFPKNDAFGYGYTVDLAYDMAANPSAINNGETTTYTINIKNKSDGPLDTVGIIFSFDATHLQFVTATAGSCRVVQGSKVDCANGPLAQDATLSFGITMRAIKSGSPDSTIIVYHSNHVEYGNDSTSVDIEPAADLSVTRTVDKSAVVPGETVEHTLTIKNNGPDIAETFSLSDSYNETLFAVDSTTVPANCEIITAAIFCDFTNLGVGASTVITYQTLARDTGTSGSAQFTLVLEPNTPIDLNSANNSATNTVNVSYRTIRTSEENFWKIDGVKTYQITAAVANGTTGMQNIRVLINYQGSNSSNRRGYFAWNEGTTYTFDPNSTDQLPCGTGKVDKYNGTTNGGFGKDFIDLVGCSTSVTSQGQRTVTFTVRPRSNFGDFARINDISLWTTDTAGNVLDWQNYDINFGSDGTPPSKDALSITTIANNYLRIDGVTSYTITAKATDMGSGIQNMRTLINYQGSNSSNRRGYFAWNEGSTYTFGSDSTDQFPCGTGKADKYNGTTSGGFGKDFIDLVGCSTSVTSQGQRTVTFTVRPRTNFGDFARINDISFWTMDTAGNVTDSSNGSSGWDNYDINFGATKYNPIPESISFFPSKTEYYTIENPNLIWQSSQFTEYVQILGENITNPIQTGSSGQLELDGPLSPGTYTYSITPYGPDGIIGESRTIDPLLKVIPTPQCTEDNRVEKCGTYACVGSQSCDTLCTTENKCAVSTNCSSVKGRCGAQCSLNSDCQNSKEVFCNANHEVCTPICSTETATKGQCVAGTTDCHTESGFCNVPEALSVNIPAQTILFGTKPTDIVISGGTPGYSITSVEETPKSGSTGLRPTLNADDATISFPSPAIGTGEMKITIRDSLEQSIEVTIVVYARPNLANYKTFTIDSTCDKRTGNNAALVGEICTLVATVTFDDGSSQDVSREVFWDGTKGAGVFLDGDTNGKPDGRSDIFILPAPLTSDTPRYVDISASLLISDDPEDPDAVYVRNDDEPIRFEIKDPGRLSSLEISSECDTKTKSVGDDCTLKANGKFADGTLHDLSNIVEFLGYQTIGKLLGTKAGDPKNGILEITKRGIATITAYMPFSIFDGNPGISGDDTNSIADVIYKNRGDGVSSETSVVITAVDPTRITSITVSSPNCDGKEVPIGTVCVLQASGIYEDGTSYDISNLVTWIGHEAVLGDKGKLGENGVLTTGKAGTAVIHATLVVNPKDSSGGSISSTSSDSITITVINPGILKSITVSSNCSGIKIIGDVCTLRAMGTFASGERDISDQVTWNGISALAGAITGMSDMVITKAGVATISATRAIDPENAGAGSVSSNSIEISAVDPGEIDSIAISSPCSGLQKKIGEYCQLKAEATYKGGEKGDVSEKVTWTGFDQIGVVNGSLLEINKRENRAQTEALIFAHISQTSGDIRSPMNAPIRIIVVEKLPEIRNIYTIGNPEISRNTHTDLYIDVFSENGISELGKIHAFLYEGMFGTPEEIPAAQNSFTIIEDDKASEVTEGINSALIKLPIYIPVFADMQDGPFTFLVKIDTNSGNTISKVYTTYLGMRPSGDVSGNGFLDKADISMMLKIVNSEIQASEQQIKRSDFNGNRQVDLIDAIFALRKYAE
ncbi:DUF11 domain-containing protein [Candidatus Peregrinibacteria bacterium]|nr:DUF11 domain-containing protein [Candidatus Peregrinibacteria bacterium]